MPSKEALKALPKTAVVVPPKRALDHWTGAKEALKALPKTAVAAPPKRSLRKFLQWEKHKQGELEVLPKRVLTCFQSIDSSLRFE